jgi:small nuclear ribonucleoprotein
MSADMAIKVLDESLGKIVLIKLKGGKTFKGILEGFDQHMNIVIKESEELDEEKPKELGTIIVRGDNVVIISPPPS